jgi:hypothetical protein
VSLTIEPYLVAFLVAHRVAQAVVTSFHSVTGQIQMLEGIMSCGCYIRKPRDHWCVTRCRGLPKQQVTGQARVLFRTLGWPGSSPQCRGWMPCKQGRWIILRPNSSGAMRLFQVFLDCFDVALHRAGRPWAERRNACLPHSHASKTSCIRRELKLRP